MKKTLLIFICSLLFSISSFAQYRNNWAVGLKVGEPLGLNIRKYFREGERTFDVNIGTYGFLYGDVRNYRNEEIYSAFGGMVQGIYSYHRKLFNSERNHLYYGFGGQVNSRNRPLGIGTRDSFRVISIGPTVNSGIEFAIPSSDMGFFIDAGAYAEIAPKPLFMNLQANCGLRVNLIK